jgi:hypothetical protein
MLRPYKEKRRRAEVGTDIAQGMPWFTEDRQECLSHSLLLSSADWRR